MEIEADNSGWVTEFEEHFAVSSGAVEDELMHDAAGNLTYDGRYHYRYDPWNRLVDVQRAYDTGSGTGSRIAELRYDGLGRRTVKKITRSADWDGTTHYYHDANYNVLGLLNEDGDLIERYDYTPYGRHSIYSRGWLLADITGDGVVDDRFAIDFECDNGVRILRMCRPHAGATARVAERVVGTRGGHVPTVTVTDELRLQGGLVRAASVDSSCEHSPNTDNSRRDVWQDGPGWLRRCPWQDHPTTS